MPGYLVYAPQAFPELVNALQPLGPVAADMPNILAVSTDKGLEEVAALVKATVGAHKFLVVEAADLSFQGDGHIAFLGRTLRGEP